MMIRQKCEILVDITSPNVLDRIFGKAPRNAALEGVAHGCSDLANVLLATCKIVSEEGCRSDFLQSAQHGLLVCANDDIRSLNSRLASAQFLMGSMELCGCRSLFDSCLFFLFFAFEWGG